MTTEELDALRGDLDPVVADAAQELGFAIADALEFGRRVPDRLPVARALLILLRNAGDGLAGAPIPLALTRNILRKMGRLGDAKDPVCVARVAVVLARDVIEAELVARRRGHLAPT